MNKREVYIEKVKKGIELYEAMNSLEDGQDLNINYGKEKLDIHCSVYNYKSTENTEKSYSIGERQLFGKRMNIDLEKSGKSYLLCYTYDLFSNRTTHKLDFSKVENIEIIPMAKEEEK